MGGNLLALLTGRSRGRVLTIGTGSIPWGRLFPDPLHAESPEALSEHLERPDLVIYHTDCARGRAQLAAHLATVRGHVGRDGHAIVLARNFFSVRNLRRLLRRGGHHPRGHVVLGRDGFRSVMDATSFPHVSGFLSTQGLEAPANLVSLSGTDFEVATLAHPVLRAARALGAYSRVAGDFVFILGPRDPARGGLFERIGSEPPPAHGSGATVERIDIRLRGALVVVLADPERRRTVLRVASDPETDAVVGRNHAFLAWLHGGDTVSPSVRSRIPIPLDRIRIEGAGVYRETLLPGTPAWKCLRPWNREAIRIASERFVWQLQLDTRRATRFDRDLIVELFRPGLARLERVVGVASRLKDRVVAALDAVADGLGGREGWLVAAHGDYGYGNILVDPETGDLEGVIDWDTGHEEELPGIDLLNLRVQAERATRQAGVLEAFRTVAHALEADGALDPEGRYATELGTDLEAARHTLLACLLRYLLRSTRYPEVFAAERDDYLSSLELLQPAGA